MEREYNVIIKGGEDGYLISEVVELPGCRTQAKTTEELMKRTREAIELYSEANPKVRIEFKGMKKIAV